MISRRIVINNGLMIDPANGIFQRKKILAILGERIDNIDEDIDDFKLETPERGFSIASDFVGVTPSGGVYDVGYSDGVTPADSDGMDDVFDAEGAFVSPGFIDAHAHVLEYATQLGVNADDNCLRNGDAFCKPFD